MVPTFTCGFLRSNTPLAMTNLRKYIADFRLPLADCQTVPCRSATGNRQPASKLVVRVELTTSSLPRTRSATELHQRHPSHRPATQFVVCAKHKQRSARNASVRAEQYKSAGSN